MGFFCIFFVLCCALQVMQPWKRPYTGVAIKGEGICQRVPLSLQNIEIIEDFLPLDLGSDV